MSRYELYLFLHITAALIWVGGGFMLIVLGIIAEGSRDETRLRNIFEQIGSVAERVIVPASLAVLALGILMIVDGPWSLGELWLVLGLLGFLSTFAIGIGILTPGSKRVGETLATEGMTPETATGIRRLLTIARLDTVLLFVIVFDMAVKPTGDDAGVLIAMALVVAAAIAYVVMRLRALVAEGTTPAATAAA